MKNRKSNLKVVLGAILLMTVLASCNRGGYGCPYEMSAFIDVFNLF